MPVCDVRPFFTGYSEYACAALRSRRNTNAVDASSQFVVTGNVDKAF